MAKIFAIGSSTNRIEDDEILYVTLMLMFGEPPRSPFRSTDDTCILGMSAPNLEGALRFSQDSKEYGVCVKSMMKNLGHDPNQGLFTSYMHWVKEQWDGKANEKV